MRNERTKGVVLTGIYFENCLHELECRKAQLNMMSLKNHFPRKRLEAYSELVEKFKETRSLDIAKEAINLVDVHPNFKGMDVKAM